MSLNWREIDAVLAELDLAGNYVQQVIQPDYRNLYLEIFRPGRRAFLRICLETGRTRIHTAAGKPYKPRVRQRFAQLLHSRVKGARIVAVRQVNADRIVRMDLERAGETTILWVRLWGGAANILFTDEEGTIIDAFFRRPKKQEVSGGSFYVEERDVDPEADEKLRAFASRWEHDVDDAIRAHYRDLEEHERRTRAIDGARSLLHNQAASTRRRLHELERKTPDSADAERLRTLGDLLLSHLHAIQPNARWAEVEDYTRDNATVTIELDPSKSAQANAESYYDRAQKAERRQGALLDEIENLRQRLARLERQEHELETMSTADVEALVEESATRRKGAEPGEGIPGLQFESHGFRLLVGRNARENDELLRRHVRGNDVWLHTRDFPGGYVFVKSKRGKSVPLDVLLDAGNLAVHYSKAKSNGRADLYYTQVKFLRRAKNGPKGLVLPTQEKNLHVVVDEYRLSQLMRDRAP